MAAPKETSWSLEPHTRAKHEILSHYLRAWTPILASGFPDVVYVDGFAGPGKYESGEDGSPIIALRAALTFQARIKGKVRFLFIEKDRQRARALEERVKGMKLPGNIQATVVPEYFEQGLRNHLLGAPGEKRNLPPTFAFIDPFGWTGTPFALVREILSNASCEVLINFMFEEVNRFISHPDQGSNFDSLFGTDEWRTMNSNWEAAERREFLHGLYLRQLRVEAGAKYVRSFEMRNQKDATDYFLFFATNSQKGIEKMKEAMWKVDQSGEFRFSDATNPDQTLLFSNEPNFVALKSAIKNRFAGSTTTVGDLATFVLAETPFRETHYKQQILAPMENDGELFALGASAGRRRGTYADPLLKLRFA